MELDVILEQQRKFFHSGTTLSVEFRLKMLKRLYSAVKKHEPEIAAALKEDLGKSEYESFMCESGLALSEIGYMIKHIRAYARRKIVYTPISQFASVSYKLPTPYGNVLIMSPWNYPFLLSIEPLCNAIAAGNTAIVKPSAYSPATSHLIEQIISECFQPKYIAVVTGGRKENSELLNKKFDFVFFTGSQNVGREVLRHTAETLTPAVLELGGKSPCIVDHTAKIELAAKRIVFGKYLNCGQTCVAPDYVLCDSAVKDKLVKAIVRQINLQYGSKPLENPDYGHIVNQKHFDRLMSLIDREKVVVGGCGNSKSLQIEPTVMDNVTIDDAVMSEEIFGPILPILTYDKFSDIFKFINGRAKPLALYIFSQDRNSIKSVTQRISYGGGCINDVVVHLATSEMGFGRVGESGMGSYHGRDGFNTFSHTKSILDKKTWIDLPMSYQPYDRVINSKLVHMFLK